MLGKADRQACPHYVSSVHIVCVCVCVCVCVRACMRVLMVDCSYIHSSEIPNPSIRMFHTYNCICNFRVPSSHE